MLDGGFASTAGESLWSVWRWGDYRTPLYTGLVSFDDGSADMMVRRERPSLVFDDEGEPTVLLTAVCPPGDHSGQYCYTLSNPVTPSRT